MKRLFGWLIMVALIVVASVAQRTAAEHELDNALGPLLALGQTYPPFNSSSNFLNPGVSEREYHQMAR